MTDALPATLTTAQVAGVLGVKESAVRMLVLRGKLHPIRPGAHPLRFTTAHVFDLQVTRRPVWLVAEHEAMWADVDAELERMSV